MFTFHLAARINPIEIDTVGNRKLRFSSCIFEYFPLEGGMLWHSASTRRVVVPLVHEGTWHGVVKYFFVFSSFMTGTGIVTWGEVSGYETPVTYDEVLIVEALLHNQSHCEL